MEFEPEEDARAESEEYDVDVPPPTPIRPTKRRRIATSEKERPSKRDTRTNVSSIREGSTARDNEAQTCTEIEIEHATRQLLNAKKRKIEKQLKLLAIKEEIRQARDRLAALTSRAPPQPMRPNV